MTESKGGEHDWVRLQDLRASQESEDLRAHQERLRGGEVGKGARSVMELGMCVC